MTTETSPDAERVYFTAREHKYLWLMAQGYTPRQAQPILGTTSTPSLSTRVRDKLGALTMEQAIYLACQRDLLGPYEECGSMRGYRAHRGRHEDPCRACHREFLEYTERNETIIVKRVDLSEAEVRLLRAFDSGRSFRQVSKNWGCSSRTLDDVRTSLYRKLDVSHLPHKVRYIAALDEGRRLGFLVPEAMPNLKFHRSPRRWGTTDLTDLEVRTLAALSAGASLSEAGTLLGIPGSSVSSRLARIYKKLGVLDHGHGLRREAAIKEARARGYAV
jgi:DNA-binding CsgD family transcriptional regulator